MSEHEIDHKEEHKGLPSPAAVRSAVDIYLKVAYPAAPPPAAVKNLLNQFPTSEQDFYRSPPFTRTGSGNSPCFYLRLGNHNYPHMKLQIETWPGGVEYFFRADTHDRHIAVPQDHPEFKAFSEMSKRNQEIADLMEEEWHRAGLPTFKGRLEKEITLRQDPSA